MPHIKLNNANLFYEIQGQGQPLILIAGYSCDHSLWQDLLPLLIDKFRILIFDNRGSGQTEDGTSELSIEMMAADAFALGESLGLKNPHILGHSMGGSIAMMLALQYSNQINKLMIFNSSAKFSATSSAALHSIVQLQQNSVKMDLLIDCFMPWAFSADFLSNANKVVTYKEKSINYPYQQTLEGNKRQLHALDIFDLQSSLNKITARTLIVGTDNDHLVSQQEINHLASNIPNSTLQRMAGGHVMLIEQPKIYAEIISEFLRMS